MKILAYASFVYSAYQLRMAEEMDASSMHHLQLKRVPLNWKSSTQVCTAALAEMAPGA